MLKKPRFETTLNHLSGQWELGPGHQIRLKRTGAREDLILKGYLIAAAAGELAFSVNYVQEDNKVVTRIHKLEGSWQTDDQNRLTFSIERKTAPNTTLVFKNAWHLNKNHEMEYRYEIEDLKTKRRISTALTLRGYWQLNEAHRLTYVISRGQEELRFRGTFQTNSILAKDGEIHYQLGAETKSGAKSRHLVLFGKWKFTKDLALEFEIDYGGQARRAMTFGAIYSIDSNNQISASLISRKGESLGCQVVFNKKFGAGNDLFLKLQKNLNEAKIEGGVSILW